jgi:hypothetical protein
MLSTILFQAIEFNRTDIELVCSLIHVMPSVSEFTFVCRSVKAVPLLKTMPKEDHAET